MTNNLLTNADEGDDILNSLFQERDSEDRNEFVYEQEKDQ